MKKKVLSFLAMFIVILSSIGFACEPNDPGCTETTEVSGNINVGFNRLHGDEINGGFQSLMGDLCGGAIGTASSSFNGKIDSIAEGAYDADAGTSFSRTKMTFDAISKNIVGSSAISAQGAVMEGSNITRGNNTDVYAGARQIAGATLDTVTTSTETQRELNFAAALNAEGTAGSTFVVDGASKSLTTFANNIAAGPTTAFTANEIFGGLLSPQAKVIFDGSAVNNCPGGTSATAGFGSAAIAQTDIANGLKVTAIVNVTENASH